MVLLDKALLGLPYGYREAPEEWKFYLTREDVEARQTYIEENMAQIYENWQFILFAGNQARTECAFDLTKQESEKNREHEVRQTRSGWFLEPEVCRKSGANGVSI